MDYEKEFDAVREAIERVRDKINAQWEKGVYADNHQHSLLSVAVTLNEAVNSVDTAYNAIKAIPQKQP